MSEDTRNLGQTVESLTQRASLLVSEEIALAKAEVTEAVTKLGRGAIIGIAAGIFAIWAILMLFFGLAAFITWALDIPAFWGYFIVSALLLTFAAIAGFVASKLMKSGAKKPTMALDEAKLIKETVTSDNPAATVGAPTNGAV